MSGGPAFRSACRARELPDNLLELGLGAMTPADGIELIESIVEVAPGDALDRRRDLARRLDALRSGDMRADFVLHRFPFFGDGRNGEAEADDDEVSGAVWAASGATNAAQPSSSLRRSSMNLAR